MKRIPVLIASLVLTGCPGIRDRIPLSEKAGVTLKGDHVCVTVQPRNDEKLEAISIYKVDLPDDRKNIFFSPPESIDAARCVPDNGYIFEENITYYFSTKLTSAARERAGEWPFSREFAVEFRLRSSNGKVTIEEPGEGTR
ncbi:putative T6SS immunity periplasmic lipoprotein [Pantoea cypripedii]|uniref:putative T6SS immunity periplasmic lipoprotein n=1 Tax=Pantoea cypripedii TaxID=55209 RepID=UPI001ABEEE53|nr:putative T6SS immunity periplasmic lipoprotein [Pantoea cypripedii]